MKSFIGRKNELKHLESFCKDDNTKLLFVIGDSGIGKTTLLNEFTNKASDPYLIFNFRPEPGESLNNYIFQWINDIQTGKAFYRGEGAWKEIMHNEAKIADFIKMAFAVQKASMAYRLAELLDRLSSILKSDGKLVIIMDPESDLEDKEADALLKCFLKRKLTNIKIILTQRTCSVFDRKSEFSDISDIDKISKLTLSGFPEDESSELLLEVGLCDEIGDDMVQMLLGKAEGNPLYIEYSIKLIKQAIKAGETIESVIEGLLSGIDNLILKMYEKITNRESLDIVKWASLLSGRIDLDIVSFLTALSKDNVEDLISDKDMSIIFDLQKNEESHESDTDTLSNINKSNNDGQSNGKMIIEPLHQRMSALIIGKMTEHSEDDLSKRYKSLSTYFLNKSINKKDNFEALRYYHLYLYLSMDREPYIKATDMLTERFYSFKLKDSCIEILERAVKYSHELGKSKEDYVELVSKAGIICHEQRHIDKAIEFFNQSISIYKEMNNDEGVATDLGNLGVVYRDTFKIDEAKKCLEESLEIYNSINNLIGQSGILTQMWKIDYEICNFDKAIVNLLKLMVITKEYGDDDKMLTILGNIGNLYCGSGDFDKAVVYYEQALDVSRRLRNTQKVALFHSRIGISYLYNQLYFEALEYFTNALKIYQEIGNTHGEATQYGNIGIVNKKIENLDDAITYFKLALELFTKKGASSHINLMRKNITTVKKMQEEKGGKD
ncbi:MAG: tetratricopeptide repeat protein [Candidatus Anammoxibacter sp.]